MVVSPLNLSLAYQMCLNLKFFMGNYFFNPDEIILRPWAAEIFRPLTSEVRRDIRVRGQDKEMVKKSISKSSSTRIHVTGAQLYL